MLAPDQDGADARSACPLATRPRQQGSPVRLPPTAPPPPRCSHRSSRYPTLPRLGLFFPASQAVTSTSRWGEQLDVEEQAAVELLLGGQQIEEKCAEVGLHKQGGQTAVPVGWRGCSRSVGEETIPWAARARRGGHPVGHFSQ